MTRLRWGRMALAAATVVALAGCWRPLVAIRDVVDLSDLVTRGDSATAYAKRRAEPIKPLAGRIKVVAHRGYSAVAPENTLASFRAALAAGADALEFDVRLTKDGKPVVIHDGTVDRTTNGHGRVAALTFAEVRALDAGGRFSPGFARERVPTLDEVLALAAGRANILLELKAPDRALPRIVAKALERHGMEKHALVISFHAMQLVRFKLLAPEVAVGRLAYPQDPPWRRALDVKADAALGFFEALDRRAVRAAHAAGLEVYAWTVDDPDAMRRVARLGVDGIITDDVGTARRVVAAAEAAGRRRNR